MRGRVASTGGLSAEETRHLGRSARLLDVGADIRTVQCLLGRASPVTAAVYLHVTESQQRRVKKGRGRGEERPGSHLRVCSDGALKWFPDIRAWLNLADRKANHEAQYH